MKELLRRSPLGAVLLGRSEASDTVTTRYGEVDGWWDRLYSRTRHRYQGEL